MDETKKSCALCGVVKSVTDWLAHPFRPQGTALQWVLWVGLVIVAIWFAQSTVLALREEI